MQAELIVRDLSYQVTKHVENEAAGSLEVHVKPVAQMDEMELEQFVRSISALGDCV